MGLELSEALIRENMPEYLPNSSQVSGNDGFFRNRKVDPVTKGINKETNIVFFLTDLTTCNSSRNK